MDYLSEEFIEKATDMICKEALKEVGTDPHKVIEAMTYLNFILPFVFYGYEVDLENEHRIRCYFENFHL